MGRVLHVRYAADSQAGNSHRADAVTGVLWCGGFRLVSVHAGSKGSVMKIVLALCFAALCLATYGQTAKPFFSRDTWRDYIANSKKIVQLEAKLKCLSIDTMEKKGLARLQGQAQKLTGDQVQQAELEADKNWASKTESLKADIARLKLKQQNLENLYAMPAPGQVAPTPAKKSKP
jgi:hypothetical protein